MKARLTKILLGIGFIAPITSHAQTFRNAVSEVVQISDVVVPYNDHGRSVTSIIISQQRTASTPGCRQSGREAQAVPTETRAVDNTDHGGNCLLPPSLRSNGWMPR